MALSNSPSNSKRNDYWFPAKRYGWGWGVPTQWQGWLTLALFLVAVALCAVLLPPTQHPAAFVAGIAVSIALLLLVCWRKGEPTGWRWGGR